MGLHRIARLVVIAVFAAGCDGGTYLVLDVARGPLLVGEVAQLDVTLRLGGRDASAQFAAAANAPPLALPRRLVFDIRSGEGAIVATVSAHDRSNLELGRATTEGQIRRGATTKLALVLGEDASDADLAGVDLSAADLTAGADGAAPSDDLTGADLGDVDLTATIGDLAPPPMDLIGADLTPVPYQLTITPSGAAGASGSVTVTVDGVAVLSNCTSACNISILSGKTAVVTANPTTGNRLGAWSGACTGAGACNIFIDGAKSLVARFSPNANIMFVSSIGLAPPFGATAAAAQINADAFCMARAAAGNLPGTYVAWLSNSSTTAIAKLSGSRGWVRPDGRAFADQVSSLAAGNTFYPSVIDELGADRSLALPYVATGTNSGGAVAPETCNNWTSNSAGVNGMVGEAAGNSTWSGYFASPCNQTYHLYCFQTGASVAVAPAPVTARIAFLSNGTFTPGPGKSRQNADDICTAEKGSLVGTFRALMATSTQAPRTRFEDSGSGTTPWKRPDGVLIAATAAGLFDQSKPLLAIPNLDVAGVPSQYGDSGFWTGSADLSSPGAAAEVCQSAAVDWTATTGMGNGGDSAKLYLWYDQYIQSFGCANAARVLCLQD